jgi:hypothetical protein
MLVEEFPKLRIGQVALLRAQNTTGHVLDENCETARSINQKVYTVFENTDDALQFVRSFVSSKGNIECVIYNNNQETLFFITPQNIESFK